MEGYYGHPKFKEYAEEMIKIHSLKNHDYSSEEEPLANFRITHELIEGIPDSPFKIAFSRLIEKILRISQVAKKGNLVNESLKDSLLDGANYCLICEILLEEYGSNPEGKPLKKSELEIEK